jgi:hypothetical protein
VRPGGDYRVAGVLAGTEPVEQLAPLIAERGVTAVAGRILAGSGGGCVVRWAAPAAADVPRRGGRKAPAKAPAKAPTDALPSATRKSTTPSGGRGHGRR